MRLSVTNKVNLGFGLALLVLGLAGYGSYQTVTELVKAAEAGRHTHRTVVELQAVRASVASAEAAQKAYLLAEDRAYLAAAEAHLLTAQTQARAVRQLEGMSPAQRGRLDDLDGELQGWAEALKFARAPGGERRGPVTRGPLVGDPGERITAIDRIIGELIAAEDREFQELGSLAKRSAGRANQVILLASVLSLLIAVICLVVVHKDVRALRLAEEAVRQSRLDLEVRVRERTAELNRTNEELQAARSELEMRVLARTGELARANEVLHQEIDERALIERALRETGTLQRAILDSANYAIISTDPRGTIRTFNAAARRWLGYDAQDLIGKQSPVLFHDPDEVARRREELLAEPGLAVESDFDALVARARRGGPDESEWTYLARDGRRFPVLLSVTALRDEPQSLSGFLLIGSDITGRKRDEENLRRMKEAAEGANRAKSDFLANMSHELRTPLNSVIGFTNVLLKNKAGNLRGQDLTYLNRVLENGKHLLDLINQVLDLAKIEAGRMDLDTAPVALDALVHETLGQLEAQVRDKDVELVADLPPRLAPLEGDAGKLKQVLINLVGNAIKFTERGSVTVRVLADPGTARPLCLEVADTGIGIPPDKLDGIFEAFQQAEGSTTKKYGGTGLGLTIARSLCRLMGYRIEARSKVGAGTTFRVLMAAPGELPPPATPSPDGPGAIRALPAASLEGRQVLVIDDDSDSRILLSGHVEELGCRVAVAGSGEDGLRTAEEVRPDLIVLDLMMPGMSGWEVLKVLKSHPTLSEVPVVVVSVAARENRGTVFGAVDLLDKPVSRETLAEVLRRNLGARRGKALVVDDNPAARGETARYLAEEGVAIREAADGAEALEELRGFNPDVIILGLVMPAPAGVALLKALRRHAHRSRPPVIVISGTDLTAEDAAALESVAAAVVLRGDELASDLRRVVRDVLGRAPVLAGGPEAVG
jgi:PAS domain S-box-containing protein